MSSNLKITKTCSLCGSSFIAQKLTTKYCSHKCSQRAYKLKKREELIKITTENSSEFKPIQNDSSILNSRQFLSVVETAQLLGVCRATINNYCIQGKLKCIKMNRKIFIRRSDIDLLFESAPSYQVTPRKTKPKEIVKLSTEPLSEPQECITEFYTADELAKRFNYSKSAIHKMAATRQIPKTIQGGVYLYSKPHFDELLADKEVNPSITEWYTVEEIASLYTMTKTAVYSFVSMNSITKRNQGGKMLYAKSEVDALLYTRLGDNSITEWYTREEIKEAYGFEPGYTANFVFKNKIPKKRIGNRSYYSKEHFDRAVAERKPSTEYITVERAMEIYGVSRDALYACVKRHNIPKSKEGQSLKLQKSALEALFNPTMLYQ